MESLVACQSFLGRLFFLYSYFVIIIVSFIILYHRFRYVIAPLTWKQLSQKMLSFTTLMNGASKNKGRTWALPFTGLKTRINSQRTCASTVQEFFLEDPGILSPGSWASQ
jgi:hypothetical protein